MLGPECTVWGMWCVLSKFPIRHYTALLVCSWIMKNNVPQNHVSTPAVLDLSVFSKWWWMWCLRCSETCTGKALEVLLHCVASLSSSVLCKEREVNPMRLTNPCQGPALSRTQGTASQGLTPSTAVAACQACSGCRWGRRFTGNKARVCLEHRVSLWRHGNISLNALTRERCLNAWSACQRCKYIDVIVKTMLYSDWLLACREGVLIWTLSPRCPDFNPQCIHLAQKRRVHKRLMVKL